MALDESQPSLRAELYALLHRGNPGDLAFYRRFCAGAGSVLELGAGYGRLAIALARSGSEVVAVDLDREMLALAATAAAREPSEVRARLSHVVADMARLSLGRRFDRVIIAYNTLCCLLDPAEVRSCLCAAREHLAPGGRLALDVYRADDSADATEDEDEPVVAIEHRGAVYHVYEHSEWQSGTPQRLDTRYRFVPEGKRAIIEHTIRQRYLRADELEGLLGEAGLTVVARAGGFRGEPLDDEAEQLVLVAERA